MSTGGISKKAEKKFKKDSSAHSTDPAHVALYMSTAFISTLFNSSGMVVEL